MQSKTHSLIETILNTFIGFIISLATAPLAYWICGVEITSSQNLGTAIIMTIISLIRGYTLRRFCNKHLHSLVDNITNSYESKQNTI